MSEYESLGIDTFKLTGRTFAEWFGRCWREAGGDNFKVKACMLLPDEKELYDLIEQKWGPMQEEQVPEEE